jgi:hypothetical protein
MTRRGSPFEPPECLITGVPCAKMRVGYNYPWAWEKPGLYFGGGDPPGSSSLMDKWVDSLKTNLPIIQQDTGGVDLIRIFLMCNLANFGTATRTGTSSNFDYSYTLPASLDPKFIDHLTAMLTVFRDFKGDKKMQVIPSLISFDACLKLFNTPGSGCTSKYEIITDSSKGTAFLDMVLEPMLTASVPFKDQIFAWEVMNEPHWVTSRPKLKSSFGQELLDDSDMTTFLSNALSRIKARGVFKSTVGHRFASDMSKYGETVDIKQFHWYPTTWGTWLGNWASDNSLPDHDDTLAIIGEFAAGPPHDANHAWWPENPGEEKQDTASRVANRLWTIESRGYDVAIIWPDRSDPHGGGEWAGDDIKLSPEARAGIKRYLTSP